MQDIETKDNPRLKPTIARVKWLEEKPNEFWAVNSDTNERVWFPINTYGDTAQIKTDNLKSVDNLISICGIEFTKEIKHLSLLNRLKRMFKR